MNRRRAVERLKPLFGANVGIFIGAGMSVPAGLPEWNELVAPYAKEMKLGVSDISLPRLMQYYCATGGARRGIVMQDLRARLEAAKITPSHRLISKLGLPRVWTTNFDTLLEDAFADERIPVEVISTDAGLVGADYSRPQVIKMHGSIGGASDEVVLLEADFENYLATRPRIFQLLEHDLATRSFIFLGVGFDDPNLRKVLAAIWNSTGGKSHFLFTRPPQRDAQARARRLYDLWSADLRRYGVEVVELREYAEIESVLYELVGIVRGKTVAILGRHDSNESQAFCSALGRALAARSYTVHTGGGPNVGTVVAESAWAEYAKRSMDPTPRIEYFYRIGGGSTNPRRGRVTYVGRTRSEMRRMLISSEKVCIVIGTEEAESDGGLREEIALARIKGARLVPVSFTGRTAHETWLEERGHYEPGGPFAEVAADFHALAGSAPLRSVVKSVVRLCEYLLTHSYAP